MSNKNPNQGNLYRATSKWQDKNGVAMETTTIRIPAYLAKEIKGHTMQRHLEEMGKQEQEQD